MVGYICIIFLDKNMYQEKHLIELFTQQSQNMYTTLSQQSQNMYTTLSQQSQNQISKSEKEAKSISVTHKYIIRKP
jgi:hypothetical protein